MCHGRRFLLLGLRAVKGNLVSWEVDMPWKEDMVAVGCKYGYGERRICLGRRICEVRGDYVL